MSRELPQGIRSRLIPTQSRNCHRRTSWVFGNAAPEKKKSEAIHSQITVVDDLVGWPLGVVSLEDVEEDHHQGGYAPQTVKYLITRL